MDEQGLRRLKVKLQQALKGRSPLELPHRRGLRRAGVLVPLCLKDGRCHILFIRRAEGLPQHAGEMSFPGGGADPQDGSIVETALREAAEEVGIRPEDVEVVGRLDDLVTRSSFLVTPIVGVIPYPYPFRLNKREATELVLLPVECFIKGDNLREEIWTEGDGTERVYFYRCGPYTIWGATAKILRHLLGLVSCEHGT